MSVTPENADPGTNRSDTDLRALRAVLAWTGAVGLCLATAFGISAILGVSLGQSAIRVAASGFVCGVDALFAVGSATLAQRSAALRVPAIVGVLASIVSATVSLVAIWGADVGETVGRIVLVAGLLSSALGLSGFLLSQQRQEDPRAISGLMVATLLINWVLTLAVSIDIIFATSSPSSNGPRAAGLQLPLTGLTFARFLGVTSLLTLLGLLMLPLLRRAHPAYRGGSPAR